MHIYIPYIFLQPTTMLSLFIDCKSFRDEHRLDGFNFLNIFVLLWNAQAAWPLGPLAAAQSAESVSGLAPDASD